MSDATDLLYAGAAEQARMIREGETTSRELVEATLRRIARLQPALNAYRVVFVQQALADAEAADARVAAGERLPLLGVPVAIKDDADVAGQITAFGTAANDVVKQHDSDVVARLREAGAVLVGKTNVPELMIFPFTETLTYGATRNPWNTEHTPGGSSGGSGAAVAAGLCGVALGSDGGGSIRIPAAFNGIFGIKPQRDRISLGPDHHDSWNGLSVYGPLARTVADAALFLDVTATDVPDGGFLGALAAESAPLRIALASNLPLPLTYSVRLHDEQRRALEATAALLRELGHTVIEREVDYPPSTIATFAARYFCGIDHDLQALARPDLVEPRTRGMARIGRLIPEAQLARSRAAEPAIAERINRIYDEVDVVLTPGPSGEPLRVGELHGRGPLWSFNAVAMRVPWYAAWNVIGQPAASVPAGFDAKGLPLAVQLCGRPGDEGTLLRLSAQLEAARPWAAARPPVDEPRAATAA